MKEDGPLPYLERTRGGLHPRSRIQEGGWMSRQQGGTPKYKAVKSTRRTAAFTPWQGLPGHGYCHSLQLKADQCWDQVKKCLL